MAGLLLFAMGVAAHGALHRVRALPVTTGFTAGIAVVIAMLQLKDLLGLSVQEMPEHFVERVQAIALARAHDALARPRDRPADARGAPAVAAPDAPACRLRCAALVVGALGARRSRAGSCRASRPRPSPAASVQACAASLGHGIPPLPPLPLLPWSLPGPDGRPIGLSLRLVRELLPAAFAIAALGAIESLLSAVVADGMTGRKHDPDAELMAQGTGNLVAPFFGGFAATGAIARTATNVRSGARSPIAALGTRDRGAARPCCSRHPCSAACRWPRSRRCCCSWPGTWPRSTTSPTCSKVAPRSDVAVLLTCFFLTVLFDMVVAVSVGVVMAALLFMRRMAEVSEVRLVDAHPWA